jgi:hypothetical protein
MKRHLLLALGVLMLATTGPQAGDPPKTGGNWQAEIQKRIATEEYRITRQKDRFHAANRANNLRTYFTKDGAQIQRRTDPEPRWKLTMRLKAVGRAGAMLEVSGVEPVLGRCVKGMGPGALKGCLQRLEYHHRSVHVIEWYQNKKSGVEQGFDVWVRPKGQGPLRLAVEVGGAELHQEGARVRLQPPGDRPLRFGGIQAVDRRGRKLPVRLAAEGSLLLTLVDDTSAWYPVFIR